MVLLFFMTIAGSLRHIQLAVGQLKQLQCSSTQSFSRFPWVSCEKRFLHRMVVSGESHSYMVAGLYDLGLLFSVQRKDCPCLRGLAPDGPASDKLALAKGLCHLPLWGLNLCPCSC